MHLLKPLTVLAAAAAMCLATTSRAETIQVDFNDGSASVANWNNFEATNTGGSIADLIDSTGATTGVSLTLDSDNAFNDNGGTGDLNPPSSITDFFPAEVAESYAYGSNFNYNGNTEPLAQLTLSGLTPGAVLDFTFLAWRDRSSLSNGNTRQSMITATGANSDTVTIDATDPPAGTGDYVGSLSGIVADGNGEVLIEVEAPSEDGNFTYLNAMTINVVPEPGSLALLGLGGLAMLGRRRGRPA